MTRKGIFKKLTDILIEQLGVESWEVVPEARLIEDLGADRLNRGEIISAIEREWNLEIDEDTVESVTTVEDAINLIAHLCL